MERKAKHSHRVSEAAEEVSTAPPRESLKRRRMSERIKSEWDSLLWVFAAFAVFYFTNFGSTLIFNEAVNSPWLIVSAVSLLVSMGCVAYAILYYPALHSENWRERAPVLIPVATAGGLIGGISLAIAVWPVWKLYSIVILFILFMGFISAVSLIG